jgi:hypothetical protein
MYIEIMWLNIPTRYLHPLVGCKKVLGNYGINIALTRSMKKVQASGTMINANFARLLKWQ